MMNNLEIEIIPRLFDVYMKSVLRCTIAMSDPIRDRSNPEKRGGRAWYFIGVNKPKNHFLLRTEDRSPPPPESATGYNTIIIEKF